MHGGAGRAYDDPADALRARDGCRRAARRGYELLMTGASALDVVVAAVVVLEDDPLFNAGSGSTLNSEGDIEMDAMLMDGRDLGAGGVCALKGFANPILVCREVLAHSPHVLLAAQGAARFAREHGFEPTPHEALVTERAETRWQRQLAVAEQRLDTVGAVSVDRAGHVAAATSTGGITGKLPGRVGDSPQIGCVTYADDRLGAASATGVGEAIAKVVMAKHACDRLGAGADPDAAAAAAVAALKRIDGQAGIIVPVPDGRLGAAFNTPTMARAWITSDGAEGASVT